MDQPLPPSVSWDDQRVFLAVLEDGSLSAAGRTLGLAQPTVRARLDILERALGTVLFTRSPQGLLPTDHARALADHVRAMAHASDAFLRAASAPPGEVAGTVRLSVSEFVGVEVLPVMLARLRERHPRLVIELALSNAVANLTEQEADIAVRSQAPAQDTLIQRKVGEVPLGSFAHRDYLARRGVPEVLGDLAFHDLIGPDRSQADRRLAQAMLPASVLARFMVRTDSHPAVLAAIRAGLGIAVVQRPIGLADPNLVPVLPDLAWGAIPIWVVTHRDLRDVPRVRTAFDHLVDELTRYSRG